MKYVTLWISLLPAAKCPGAAHALFNVALQNRCTELYIDVCTWERGVSVLLSQLLGKFPVNIWVLRNISCDGSYQYFGILSGVGRCYQQVECVWASALPRRHTRWKNSFKKLTKKPKTNLPFLSQSGFTWDTIIANLVFGSKIHGQILKWVHFIGSRLALGTCSITAMRGLRVPCQQQSWMVWMTFSSFTLLFSLTNSCPPPDAQPSATGKASGRQQKTGTPEGTLVHPLPPGNRNVDWVQQHGRFEGSKIKTTLY